MAFGPAQSVSFESNTVTFKLNTLVFSWYSVDYSKAHDLTWGKNLGCDFVKKSCYYWMNMRNKGSKHMYVKG